MKLIPAASIAAALALALAACGSGGGSGDAAAAYAKTPPSKISTDANTAMKGLKSFHVASTIDDGGQVGSLDMMMSFSGECVGTLTMKGNTVNVITTPKGAYMKGDAGFWTAESNSSTASLLAGKWISGIPASTAKEFCPVDQVFNKDMVTDLKNGKVSGTTTVAGTPAISVSTTNSDGKKITVHVAATSPHYVLDVHEGKQSATFSDFGKPVDATAPKGAISLQQLEQQGS